jgi:hypothetical protein
VKKAQERVQASSHTKVTLSAFVEAAGLNTDSVQHISREISQPETSG